MAPHAVAVTDIHQIRRLLPADRHDLGAAGVKTASRRQSIKIGHDPGDFMQRLSPPGGAVSRSGKRLQQSPGVGMLGVLENGQGFGFFDHASGVHDHDALSGLSHDAQVMGDEEDGRAKSCCSCMINSMIWDWTVTSRAVVGSSAIRTSGLLAIAMAIMARWRMPPDNWWG